MKLALRRIKVYGKLVVVGAIAVVALLIIFMNRSRTADVWFFHAYSDVNVLWLILITAVASIVGWWGLRRIAGLVRDVREFRKTRQADALASEQRRLAKELAEREKRIDEKVRRSITDES